MTVPLDRHRRKHNRHSASAPLDCPQRRVSTSPYDDSACRRPVPRPSSEPIERPSAPSGTRSRYSCLRHPAPAGPDEIRRDYERSQSLSDSGASQHADHAASPDCLRARRERPRGCRAAEQRDELAPLVAVGTCISWHAPRPDPYVRLSRIRLLPRVCDGTSCRIRSSACDTRAWF